MNPSYGILLWLIIGAVAGWLASKVMGTDARQGAVANIVVGVVGALVGGFLSRLLLQDSHGNNGLFISTAIAFGGACIVLALWKKISAG